MNINIMIKEMTEKVDELKKNQNLCLNEKEMIVQRLKELDDILSPIQTDIDGLEIAIEGLRSTSLAAHGPATASEVGISKPEEPASEVGISKPEEPASEVGISKPEPKKKQRQSKSISSMRGWNLRDVGTGQMRASNKPVEITVFDQYGTRKKHYVSIKDAIRGLKWSNTKIYNSLLMTEKEQLQKYGFYIATN